MSMIAASEREILCVRMRWPKGVGPSRLLGKVLFQPFIPSLLPLLVLPDSESSPACVTPPHLTGIRKFLDGIEAAALATDVF